MGCGRFPEGLVDEEPDEQVDGLADFPNLLAGKVGIAQGRGDAGRDGLPDGRRRGGPGPWG